MICACLVRRIVMLRVLLGVLPMGGRFVIRLAGGVGFRLFLMELSVFEPLEGRGMVFQYIVCMVGYK